MRRAKHSKHAANLGADVPANSPQGQDRAILVRLYRSQLSVRVHPSRKAPVSTKNMAAQLRFAKLHLKKSKDLWNKVVWTDENKHIIAAVSTAVEG